MGFPGGSDDKEFACSTENLGLISGLGISPGGGNGHPLQYSCLENPMDRGAWQAIVHRVTKSQTQLKWLWAHTSSKGNLQTLTIQFGSLFIKGINCFKNWLNSFNTLKFFLHSLCFTKYVFMIPRIWHLYAKFPLQWLSK